jgi:hypothetical protein
MRPTKVLVAKLDHNMLDVEMGIDATCCVAISLIGLLSLASVSVDTGNFSPSLTRRVAKVARWSPPRIHGGDRRATKFHTLVGLITRPTEIGFTKLLRPTRWTYIIRN